MDDEEDYIPGLSFIDFSNRTYRKIDMQNGVAVYSSVRGLNWGILCLRLTETNHDHMSQFVNRNWFALVPDNKSALKASSQIITNNQTATGVPIYNSWGRVLIGNGEPYGVSQIPQKYINQAGPVGFFMYAFSYMFSNFGKFLNNYSGAGIEMNRSGVIVLNNYNIIINNITLWCVKQVIKINSTSKQQVQFFFSEWNGSLSRNIKLVLSWCQSNQKQVQVWQNVDEFFVYPDLTPLQQIKVVRQFQQFALKNSSARMLQQTSQLGRQIQQKVYGRQTIPKTIKSPGFSQAIKNMLKLIPETQREERKYRDPVLLVSKGCSSLQNTFGIIYATYCNQTDKIGDQKKKIQIKLGLMEFSRLMYLFSYQIMKLNRTRLPNDAMQLYNTVVQLQNHAVTALQNIGKQIFILSQANQNKLLVNLSYCKQMLVGISNISQKRPIPRTSSSRRQQKVDVDITLKVNKQMAEFSEELIAMNKLAQTQVLVNVAVNDTKVNILDIKIKDDVDTKQNPDNFSTYGTKMMDQPEISEDVIEKPFRKQPNLATMKGQPILLAIQGPKPLLMIQADIPKEQLYPKVPTNQIIIKTLPHQTQKALNSNRIKHTLQMATLLLIQKRVTRLEQICNRLAYYNQKFKTGQIFQPQQAFVSLQTNSSLALALGKNMQYEILICKKKILPNNSNKARIKLLLQRLKIIYSPALRICITSLIVQNQSDASIALAQNLKKDLVITDIKQLDVDTKTLLQIFLQTQQKMTDLQKTQIIDSFRFSQNPVKQIMQKYRDNLTQHSSTLQALAQELQNRKKYMHMQMANPDNNRQYQLSLMRKGQLQALQKQIKNLNAQKGRSPLGIVRQVQEKIILNQKAPQPSQKQAAAAIKIISQAHQNLLGIPKSDYITNAQIGMGISMQQINNVQNNTYYSNFSTVDSYFSFWKGLQFLSQQNYSLSSMQIQTRYFIQKQSAEIKQNLRRLQDGIAYVQFQNNVIFNEAVSINKNVLTVGQIVQTQFQKLQSRMAQIQRFGGGGQVIDSYKQKMNLFLTHQTAIQIQLGKIQEPILRLKKMQQIMIQLAQKASETAKDRALLHKQIINLQSGMDHQKSITIAGNLQLCQLTKTNMAQLQKMGFSVDQLVHMGQKISGNSSAILDRVNTLVLNYQQSSGEAKLAYLQMLQGLSMNINMVSQLCASNKEICRNQKDMVSQLGICQQQIISSLQQSNEQVVKDIGSLIVEQLMANRQEIIDCLLQSQSYQNGLLNVINNRLDSNNADLQYLKQGINNMYKMQMTAFNTLYQGERQINNNLQDIGNTLYQGMGSIYWQGNQTNQQIYSLQQALQQARQIAYQSNDRLAQLQDQFGNFTHDLKKKDQQLKKVSKKRDFFKTKLIAVLQKVQGSDVSQDTSEQKILQKISHVFKNQDKKNAQNQKIREQISRIFGILQIDESKPFQQKFSAISKASIQLKKIHSKDKLDYQKKQTQLLLVKNDKINIQKTVKEAQRKANKLQEQQQKLNSQVGNLRTQLAKANAKQEGLLQVKKLNQAHMKQITKILQQQIQTAQKGAEASNQQRVKLIKMVQDAGGALIQKVQKMQSIHEEYARQKQKQIINILQQGQKAKQKKGQTLQAKIEDIRQKYEQKQQESRDKLQKAMKSQAQYKQKFGQQQRTVSDLKERNNQLKQSIQKLQYNMVDPKTQQTWQVVAETARNQIRILSKQIQEEKKVLDQQHEYKQSVLNQKKQGQQEINKLKNMIANEKINTANTINQQRIRTLEEKLQTAQTQIQKSDALIANHSKQVQQLKQKLVAASLQIKKAQNNTQFALGQAQQKFQLQRHQANMLIQKSKQEIENKNKQIGSMIGKISGLNLQITSKKNQMNDLKLMVQTMKNQGISTTRIINQHVGMIQKLKSQIQTKVQQLKDLSSLKNQIEQQRNDLLTKVKTTQDQIKKIQEKLKQIQGLLVVQKKQKQKILKTSNQYKKKDQWARYSFVQLQNAVHKLVRAEGRQKEVKKHPQWQSSKDRPAQQIWQQYGTTYVEYLKNLLQRLKIFLSNKQKLDSQIKKNKQIQQQLLSLNELKTKLSQDLEQKQLKTTQVEDQLRTTKQLLAVRNEELNQARKQIELHIQQLRAKSNILNQQQNQLIKLQRAKQKIQSDLMNIQNKLKMKQDDIRYEAERKEQRQKQANQMRLHIRELERKLNEQTLQNTEKNLLKNEIMQLKTLLKQYQQLANTGQLDLKKIAGIQEANRQHLEEITRFKQITKVQSNVIHQYEDMISYFQTQITKMSGQLNSIVESKRYDESARVIVNAYSKQIHRMKMYLRQLSDDWKKLNEQNEIRVTNNLKRDPNSSAFTTLSWYEADKRFEQENKNSEQQYQTQQAFTAGLLSAMSPKQPDDKFQKIKNQQKPKKNNQMGVSDGVFSGSDLGNHERVGEFIITIFQQMLVSIKFILDIVNAANFGVEQYLKIQQQVANDQFRANVVKTTVALLRQIEKQMHTIITKLTQPFKGMNGSLPQNTNKVIAQLFSELNHQFVVAGVRVHEVEKYLNQ